MNKEEHLEALYSIGQKNKHLFQSLEKELEEEVRALETPQVLSTKRSRNKVSYVELSLSFEEKEEKEKKKKKEKKSKQ